MQISEIRVDFNDGREFPLKEVLIPHVIAAISANPVLKGKLESDYNKNKKVYATMMEEQDYPFLEYFKLYPAIENLLMEKLLSMYLFFEREGQGKEFINDFLNKGFKRIIDYAKRLSTVSFELFNEFLEQREENLSESKRWQLGAIYLYTCLLQEMKVEGKDPLSNFIYNFYVPLKYTEKNINEQLLLSDTETKEAYSKFQEIFGVKVSKVQTIDTLINKLEKKILSTMPLSMKRNMNEGFNIVYSKSIYRMYKTITAFLRIFNINDMYYIGDTSLTREEYLKLYAVFLKSKSMKRMSDEEFESYLGASLVLTIISNQYNRLSSEYLKRSETVELEKLSIIQDEQVLKTSREEYLQEKRIFELEKSKLLENNKLLEEELMEKEKEIKLMDSKMITSEEEKEELKLLREFVFNLNKEDDEEINEPESISAINQVNDKGLKIAVFGGHLRFHQRLRESFSNIRTIEPEELGIDLSFVANMDVILFVAKYNNHSQYERFRPLWKKDRTKLIFLNKQSAPETIAKKILNAYEQ